jgi:hypothetical protein
VLSKARLQPRGIAARRVREGKIRIDDGDWWTDLQRFVKLTDRVLNTAPAGVFDSEMNVGVPVSGRDPNGILQFYDRFMVSPDCEYLCASCAARIAFGGIG